MERSARVHPIVQLVREQLTGSSRTILVPAVPPADFHEAVARYGAGLDHLGGETPLALLVDRLDSTATARGYSAHYVVTDRRLFGRVHASNVPLTFTEVPYGQLAAAPPKPGGLAQSVLLTVGNRPVRLYIAPKPLHAFFTAMVTHVPPPARTFGPLPPPRPTPPDPLGAWAAAQALGGADPRTWVPLRALFEAHRRGTVDAREAAGLVSPAITLAREIVAGKGSDPHGWRSCLPRPILLLALHASLGPPAAVHPVPGGEILDFPVGTPSSGTGRAVASSIAGVAALATLGVGWVSISHGQRLATLRVHVTEAAGGSRYQLHGTSGGQWEPLSAHWWRTTDAVNQAVLRLESRYLLGRVLFGAARSPAELLGLPRSSLEPAVTALLGPADLSRFYPG